MNKNSKILITGGSGLVGQNLTNKPDSRKLLLHTEKRNDRL